ncbi:MAG: helix-turn-helix transcriptional regulator [Anaerosomatales bacterium]|nr:helix-turn-helix transcriptional regulator [Anaerosomatales bacterium]MDI6843659.1 helix-turn-helix transcriptional regulator [Anaerosomatales bacterium]
MATGIGQTLRALRVSRNETLHDVSRATGLSVAMLSRIERGERSASPSAILALADHFGLPPQELVGEVLAERMCARYGVETASWAAVLLVRTARPSTADDRRNSAQSSAAETVERAVSELARTAEWGDREHALAACAALRRLADAPLRALRSIRDHHPDPVVRSAAEALLRREQGA